MCPLSLSTNVSREFWIACVSKDFVLDSTFCLSLAENHVGKFICLNRATEGLRLEQVLCKGAAMIGQGRAGAAQRTALRAGGGGAGGGHARRVPRCRASLARGAGEAVDELCSCGLGCNCGLRRWDGPGLGHLDVHIEDVVELVVLNCIDPCPVWFDKLWGLQLKYCCGPGACISVLTWLELSEQECWILAPV